MYFACFVGKNLFLDFGLFLIETVTRQHFTLHQALLRDLGCALPSGARVLDFGCGAGAMVEEYRRQGFAAYGCDPKIADETAHLRRLDTPAYRIPFADNNFDFVFSDQVMEHVQDHALALAEIRRVLRPGGISLHIFPSRWKPLESHVLVPLAGVCQSRVWLSLWARLGVRTAAQKGLAAREVAARNHEYLTTRTRYLNKKELRRVFGAHFDEVIFAEKQLLANTYGGARRIGPLVQKWPGLATLYGSFYSRVILARRNF